MSDPTPPVVSLESAPPVRRTLQYLFGLPCLVLLLAIGFDTGNLTYFKLHAFVLLPALILAYVPPGALYWARPELRRVGHILPLILIPVAISYSAFWDNYQFYKGIITYDAREMVGTLGYLPLEEWFWFVDHTLLVSYFVYLVSNHSSLPDSRVRYKGWSRGLRNAGTLLCAVLMMLGLYWWIWGSNQWLWMGVIFTFMFPIIGLQWFSGSHILMRHPREVWLGILVPSVYTAILDTWAIAEEVWILQPTWSTGLRFMGVQVEQLAIYTLATILCVFTIVPIFRMAEILLDQRARGEFRGSLVMRILLAFRDPID